MKTQAIVPACIEWAADGTPQAPDFGDIYHPRVGALAQARHVFLGGNRLPARWADHEHFVILETGFGLGHNFLATWDAWRRDAARCGWLHFVSIDRHPPCVADLARAHAASPLPELARALIEAWPPLTPNLHRLAFAGGRVRLLLGFGDIAALLPELRCRADAFFLDGFAPGRNPAMWAPGVIKALARRAAPGATAATWSVARELCEGLAAAGFEVGRAPGIGGKREITVARFQPRFTPRGTAMPGARTPADAVVVGAGLAGASAAHALRELGWQVRVLDRHAGPAHEASGNPAGVFHGTLHGDDGPHARLLRAAALQAARVLKPMLDSGAIPGQAGGLLRLANTDLAAMQAQIARQGLPAEYVMALSADEASRRAGVPLPGPAWLYPGGGWLVPPALVQAWLCDLPFSGGAEVAALRQQDTRWQLLGGQGQLLAEAAVVVLANASDARRLLAPLGHAGWLLRRTRGQLSGWRGQATRLLLPLAGDGYALPLADGLLCGATVAEDDDDPELRGADHEHNFMRLHRMCGLVPPVDSATLGRVAWRVQTDDRLPVIGPLPLAALPPGTRADQARLLPRCAGLFVSTAFGGRGITLAPLAGELLAAQISGTPLPLEQSLLDVIDPGRWQVREARRQAP